MKELKCRLLGYIRSTARFLCLISKKQRERKKQRTAHCFHEISAEDSGLLDVYTHRNN